MSSINFDRALFWDIDPDTLNFKKHSRFIIERVLKKGSLEDWMNLKEYYSLNKIKEESLQIRSLDKKTLYFLSNYFGVDKTQFRCYS
jgi:hypothetical protein